MTVLTHPAALKQFPTGIAASPQELKPGAIGLTHSRSLMGALIRVGEKLEYGAPWDYWSHAFLVIDSNGTILESLAKGPTKNNISKYDSREYHLAYPPALDTEYAAAVERALVMYNRHLEYDYLTDVSLGMTMLMHHFGWNLTFGEAGAVICSGYVTACWEFEYFLPDFTKVPPAALARYLQVRPGT